MKRETRAGLILIVAAALLTGCSSSRTVTFDNVAVGAKYGLATGYAEGAVAVTVQAVAGRKPSGILPVQHVDVTIAKAWLALQVDRAEFQSRLAGNGLLPRRPPVHAQYVLQQVVSGI